MHSLSQKCVSKTAVQRGRILINIVFAYFCPLDTPTLLILSYQQFNNQLIIFRIFNNWLLGESTVALTPAPTSSTPLPSTLDGSASQRRRKVRGESRSLTSTTGLQWGGGEKRLNPEGRLKC